jgi:MraZ protein
LFKTIKQAVTVYLGDANRLLGGHKRKGGDVLFGEYNHQIDEKGRIRIPAKLKAALCENFMVTKGTAGCLFLFSREEWGQDLANKLASVPLSDLEVQRPLRMFFSSAQELEEDNQGRYLMPKNLREFAKIKKDVVLIGVGRRAEIWAREEYYAYLRGESRDVPDFDKALAGLQKYGV